MFSFVAGEFDLHLVIADNSEYNSAREDKIIRKFSQILAKKYALFFEFGKNEQFSIADYSKTIRRWKKIPDNEKLLIVWIFNKNMNKSYSNLYRFQKIISCKKIVFRNKKIHVDYFALENARNFFC